MNASFDLSQIIGILGIAVFLLPTVYLMGYARREQQHGKSVKDCEENVEFQRRTLIDMHKNDMNHAGNVIRELEISLLQAGEAIELEIQNHAKTEQNRVTSDGYRKAIVQMMLDSNLWNFVRHSDSPTAMLHILMEDAAKHAIDPVVSKQAKNLFIKGVRKGAKMGRAQMAKVYQKSIDNQAMTIELYRSDLKKVQEDFDDLLFRKNTMAQAYMNVMADKMPILSIRKAFRVAVLNETGRLRAVAAKQGE